MCKAMEDMCNQAAREAAREAKKETMIETALRMLAMGKLSLMEVAVYSGLPLEEVQGLQAKVTA